MKIIEKFCLHCGKPFKSRSTDHIFCSERCVDLYKKELERWADVSTYKSDRHYF
ncbi:MAG TPA: DUF2116 family Zn-ribbon domain-containing protein [bacterium]|nr:DUF2116 family Zn-ribbon domain-containing protein [bacterium]